MNNVKSYLLAVALMITSIYLTAQVSISTETTVADSSSMLDVQSHDKGILIPRMTQTEIEAITDPANGLVVFSTTDDKFYAYVLVESKWKEIQYGPGRIDPPAAYTIGTGGSCTSTDVNGNYAVAVALDGSNVVYIDATVTTPGHWNVTTDTLNGYSFSGSGVLTTTGTIQFTLYGSGTPLAIQTDTFTATANSSQGICTFSASALGTICGTTIDYGGKTYYTLQIGSQCWMEENLQIGTWINSSVDQTNNGTIEMYYYDNFVVNGLSYGGLYKWDEMMQYVSTEGTQGICPDGWHIPTDAEWMILEEEAESSTGVDWNTTGWRGTDAGGNMKEPDTTFYWDPPNTGATNLTGFTALPGGAWYSIGVFDLLNFQGYNWSSSEDGTKAWVRGFQTYHAEVERQKLSQNTAVSVRCIRNE